jgi:predicted transposase YdaD
MQRRLSGRRARPQAQLIWAASYILLGLRHSPALAAQLFRGVVSMKESSTYQAILEEGREEGRGEGELREARKVLRMLGEDVFGPPNARVAAALDRIHELSRLEGLLKRVRTATSWKELLGGPASGPAGRRRPT